jgi:SSS family solute:Na+ symporter
MHLAWAEHSYLALLAGTPSQLIRLRLPDFGIIVVYFLSVLGIGLYFKRYTSHGEDFFLAGRSMTAWVAGISFVAANLGTLELMGWAAATYEYGIITAHWYWIGAIPAMVFLGLFMMRFYYVSKVHSVPGYLQLRYGKSTSVLSAVSFAFMTILMSGVNMYSMAVVMRVVLGWNIHFSIWVASLTVAFYVSLGGLFSAIFNEVLQFMLIWLGGLPIAILGLIDAGGWSGLLARISHNFPQRDYTHLWSTTAHFADNPMGIHWVAIVFGLGAIGSFGYWTTDFLVVQRALSARNLTEARLAPIIGSFFKMSVPFIVILPGLLSLGLLPFPLVAESAAQAGQHTYNEVLPLMLVRYCGPGLLGLGVIALIAGFMSGMAGNVSAFSTVWTYDIYRQLIRRDAGDEHYVAMGRWCSVLGVLVSIGTAYLVPFSKSVMDYVQALASFFVPQLFGTVLLGMLWRRTTPAGGFWGLFCGTTSSILMWVWVRIDPSKVAVVALSPHAKDMSESMFRLLWSGLLCFIVTITVSLFTRPKPVEELTGLVLGRTPLPDEGRVPLHRRPVFWACVSLAIFLLLQYLFW